MWRRTYVQLNPSVSGHIILDDWIKHFFRSNISDDHVEIFFLSYLKNRLIRQFLQKFLCNNWYLLIICTLISICCQHFKYCCAIDNVLQFWTLLSDYNIIICGNVIESKIILIFMFVSWHKHRLRHMTFFYYISNNHWKFNAHNSISISHRTWEMV